MAGVLGILFGLVYFGVAVWILFSFYRALARIGEELNSISQILQERLPKPPPRERKEISGA
jgi:hypothetical protein